MRLRLRKRKVNRMVWTGLDEKITDCSLKKVKRARKADVNRIARLPDGTQMGWLAYMQSDAWKAKREEYRESGLPQDCQGCGAFYVELHHVTYRRLGNESLRDLVPVCRRCHQAIHDVHAKSQKSLRAVTRSTLKRIRSTQLN